MWFQVRVFTHCFFDIEKIIYLVVTGQSYQFVATALFLDGTTKQAQLDWIAPSVSDFSKPQISIFQDSSWSPSDDLVLRAEGHEVTSWYWFSSQINTSNRRVEM